MEALDPFDAALAAYASGDPGAELVIRRDDGLDWSVPVSHFFRSPGEFSAIEHLALDRSIGPVLDAGAGSGLHSLALQERGIDVTAIDICPGAVAIMSARGVRDARCADLLDFAGGPYQTVLMLGHGIGIVESIAGLHRLLHHAHALLPNGGTAGGQILFNSMDVRATDDPRHLAYHDLCRTDGRYIGEVRVRFEFRGECGPERGWLHMDPDTMKTHGHAVGWAFEVLMSEESGDYLGRLVRERPGESG